MAKAGELFVCAVCGDAHPDEEVYVDEQLGPTCPCCKLQIKYAMVYLKKAGLERPIAESDINPTNITRFQNET